MSDDDDAVWRAAHPGPEAAIIDPMPYDPFRELLYAESTPAAHIRRQIKQAADWARYCAEHPPTPAAKPEPVRRHQPKPNISTIIKRAEKAGKEVSSVTVDGITLTFGKPEPTNNNTTDDVEAWINKHARH